MLPSQRLVLDANVIVSSVLSAQGKARQAFDLSISTGIVLIDLLRNNSQKSPDLA
jgi:predicted nucleic acid-binding protein